MPASGPRRLVVTVNGPLEDSIANALPAADRSRASELTAVVNRLLVWDLHVARDGRKGDKLEVLWEPAPPAAPGLTASGEPVVVALRYARDFFEFASMFAVTRDAVAGHDALGEEGARERARAVAIWAADPPGSTRSMSVPSSPTPRWRTTSW